jgi:hypothetical protein
MGTLPPDAQLQNRGMARRPENYLEL